METTINNFSIEQEEAITETDPFEAELDEIEAQAEQSRQTVYAKKQKKELREKKKIQKQHEKEIAKARQEFIEEIKSQYADAQGERTSIPCPKCLRGDRILTKTITFSDGESTIIGAGIGLIMLRRMEDGTLHCPACNSVVMEL
jgi:hypothetical protein